MSKDISKSEKRFLLNDNSRLEVQDNTIFRTNEAELGADVYLGSSSVYDETENVIQNSFVYSTIGNSIYGDNCNIVLTDVHFDGNYLNS